MSAATPSAPHPAPDRTSRALFVRLWRNAIRTHVTRLSLAGVFMAIVAAANGLLAWLMEPVVNDVFIDRDTTALLAVSAAVVVTFLLKSGGSYAQEVLMARVGERIVCDIQTQMFGHLLHQDVATMEARHSGALMSRFTFDIQKIRFAVSRAVMVLGREGLTVIFLAAVMLHRDWLLSCIFLVVIPLTIYPIHRLGQRIRRLTTEVQEQMGSFASSLAQSLQGIRTVKAFGCEGFERARIGARIEGIFRLSMRAARSRSATLPLIDMVSGVAIAAVIAYGGFRVISGATTAGEFFSFITALILAYQPMRALADLNAQLQEGFSAAQRIFDLLDRRAEIVDPPSPLPIDRVPGAVRFEGVTFGYDANSRALRDVSFEAEAGRVTALVGPSGAGKSSVFNLIPRFYDPCEGMVSVNGRDVRSTGIAALRDCIALVSQEVMLFDDSVLENIRYGRPDADTDAVRRAARIAAAEEFIEDLPQGYETVLGERGLRLSGGQRQRLAIARAVLRDAPILLLDEATSALDSVTERKIQAAVERLMKGRTTVVIAHRLSTVVHADRIHVLDRGRLVQSGSHGELLRGGGLYAMLYELQFAERAERSEVAALTPAN